MEEFGNDKKIKVAYALDDKCLGLLCVSMQSLLEHTKSDVEIIILYSQLKQTTLECINSYNKFSNCNIVFQKVNADIFEGFNNAHWVTIQAWFRTLIPDLFPQYDKVLYLDCDTMILFDIQELYDVDIQKVLVGAVTDVWCIDSHCQRLALKSDTYFNSGMMLINCQKWRELGLFEKIADCAKNNKVVKYGDQDVLNVVIDADKLNLSPKYNYLATWWRDYLNEYRGQDREDYNDCRSAAKLVHFTAYKPTNGKCLHEYKDIWWDYAKKTPCYISLLENFRIETMDYIKEITQKLNNK